jgi:hypothetical protein
MEAVIGGEGMTLQDKADYLNNLAEAGIVPPYLYCVCDGYVGSWRMLPNGTTVFYAPKISQLEAK